MPVPVLAGDQRRSLGVSSPQFLNPPPVNIAHHSTPALKGCLISCSCSLRTRAFSPAPAARVQREASFFFRSLLRISLLIHRLSGCTCWHSALPRFSYEGAEKFSRRLASPWNDKESPGVFIGVQKKSYYAEKLQ